MNLRQDSVTLKNTVLGQTITNLQQANDSIIRMNERFSALAYGAHCMKDDFYVLHREVNQLLTRVDRLSHIENEETNHKVSDFHELLEQILTIRSHVYSLESDFNRWEKEIRYQQRVINKTTSGNNN